MTAPKRIQRKRTKGWRMPEGAVYVGRGSRWGNPYAWKAQRAYPEPYYLDGEMRDADDMRRIPDAERRRRSVVYFEDMLRRAPIGDGTWGQVGETAYSTIRRELAGKDLACWCPLEDEHGNRVPCHADVLLEIANRPQPGADQTCTECGEPVDRDGLTTGECGGGGGQKCGECFACSCDGSC